MGGCPPRKKSQKFSTLIAIDRPTVEFSTIFFKGSLKQFNGLFDYFIIIDIWTASVHLRIAWCISMSSKCMIVLMMLSTVLPVTQSCSSSRSRSKKLSKIYHDHNEWEEDHCNEGRNSSFQCYEACNFSSECDVGSGCPSIADAGGCYCKQGFCFFGGLGQEREAPEVPKEYRCSDYTDCECRWHAVWKKDRGVLFVQFWISANCT